MRADRRGGTIRVVRMTVVSLLVSAVLPIAVPAQAPRLSPLHGRDEAPLVRALDEAARRRRAADPWVQWEGHFLQGSDGRTYVPYTLRLERAADAFESVAIAVRVVGWNYVFSDSFAAATEADGDDRVFRGAFLLQPGRCTVYVAVQDRETRSRVAIGERVTAVPGFGKGLRVSSVIVVDRVEPVPQPLTDVSRTAYPYALGPIVLFPSRKAEFTRDRSLTVAFQVYNAATFEDGRPDVEIRYRVFREDGERRALGATAPQLFDQDTLPEEFDIHAGHQLTPVQSLPLAQFEPGTYRLQIDVQDHLGGARADAAVPFTILR
jgi:hypothetical protein